MDLVLKIFNFIFPKACKNWLRTHFIHRNLDTFYLTLKGICSFAVLQFFSKIVPNTRSRDLAVIKYQNLSVTAWYMTSQSKIVTVTARNRTLTGFGFVLIIVAGFSHPVHVQVVTQFLSVSSQHRVIFDRSRGHVVVRIVPLHYFILQNKSSFCVCFYSL